ncbi:hypothetical protein PTNB85_04892 [Pyrenophora teres f. teres]|uniref:Uncharacterized protein n=1 Tax=Pyrenophora teres f. teres TaxID=97479 RepID=A0A6S6VPL9_9PLEO|nr:hypothetical protein HRS9139_04569 [Pyrenophora teres f. teres]KAE8837557.1 hypothetical protein PTNB85_04892 [Pyrenophora teres f. teres]KAE8840023.1 hypothetical protein HRS9122_06628 [Pyrenophora teres f. teres]CAE6996220.1 hypothetical protein PTTW11_00299 [Pyrenophora teres f. teres]
MAGDKGNTIASVNTIDKFKNTKETTSTAAADGPCCRVATPAAHSPRRQVGRGGGNPGPVTPGRRVTTHSVTPHGPAPENEGDDDTTVYSSPQPSEVAVDSNTPVESSPLVNAESPSESETFHIILIYLSLLALSRHSTRPVVDLNMNTQLLQLDAFLAGHITADGDATQWLPESETPVRRQRYTDLCVELVPNLTATIKRQSQENRDTEPKNQAQGDKNPEHTIFWKMYLAPELVKSYGKLVQRWRRDDKDFNPDMDPWTEPQRYNGLIELLNAIVAVQYNFEQWRHISPEPDFNQMLRPVGVEFQRVMRDPTSIQAYYSMTTPQGKRFWQHQIIPETNTKITEYDSLQIWRLKEPGSIYLLPDPKDVTVPRLPKDKVWMKVDENGQKWTCGRYEWSPTLIFYVFDKKTNAYINHHVLPPDLLDTMDLNDRAWSVSYRKKIAQWRNRATLQSTTTREAWSIEERAAAYEWANAYCRENGIDKLRTAVADQKKKEIHDVIKEADGHDRSPESVGAWMRHQMSKKPKEPLGRLHTEHRRVLALINAGKDVPGRVQFPDQFIDIEKFKREEQAKIAAKEDTKGRKKRKRHEGDEEDGEEEDIVDDAGEEITAEPNKDVINDSCNYDLEDDTPYEIDKAYQQEESDNLPNERPKRAKLDSKSKFWQRVEVAEEQPHPKLYIKLKGMTKDEEMAAAEAAGRAADRAAAAAEGKAGETKETS